MLHSANVLPAWQNVSVENLSTGPQGNEASQNEDYPTPPSWWSRKEKTAKYEMGGGGTEGLSKTDRTNKDQDEDMKKKKKTNRKDKITKEFTELIT